MHSRLKAKFNSSADSIVSVARILLVQSADDGDLTSTITNWLESSVLEGIMEDGRALWQNGNLVLRSDLREARRRRINHTEELSRGVQACGLP